jgi:RNAse (barnase) inhibitor barstar
MMAEGQLSVAAGRSGVYATPLALGALQQAAQCAGLAWLAVDLAPVVEKMRFLAECARDLRFPETFGANWDALADCLEDFSWWPAPGFVIRFVNAQVFAVASPHDFAAAVEILRNAAIYWEHRGKPFIVLVDGALALPPFHAT